MTDKQAKFVDEYLVDLNATQAAIRAGYSENTAAAIGAENLRKPKIAAAIHERQAELKKATEVTQERVIEEYRRIAFADVRSLFTWDEERAAYVPSRDLTDEEAAAISSVKAKTTTRTYRRGDSDETETDITLELKTYDKLKALADLGKHLGMFVERIDVTSGGKPLTWGDSE